MNIDSATIRKLHGEHGAPLTLYARQFFRRGSFHAAEEVVQEVFVRLNSVSPPPENVVGWLYASVRNGAISAARSDKRREKRESDRQPPLFHVDAEAPFDSEKISLALEKLAPLEREIITLHLWGDRPFSEIGPLLGLPKTTVFRRYAEALETLRRLLEE